MPDGYEITGIDAVEVLDSRGRPTLAVTVAVSGHAIGAAGVPAGASTGSREAVERRDGDPSRYGGQGVTMAAAAVTGEIAGTIVGRRFLTLADLDRALIDLDGTPTKGRLGANAVVGVSMAAAQAFATRDGKALYEWLPSDAPARLPVPHFNVVNGGAHAQNPLDFQEFMVAPVGAPNVAEALRAGSEIHARLRALLHHRGLSTGLGDEGGFAPDLEDAETALGLLVEAIEEAGYTAAPDQVAIALDPAASELFTDGVYRVAGATLDSDAMIDLYAELVERFPIRSIEDGLAESDWDGWRRLTERLGERVTLVGDDIFVTDPATISKGVAAGTANAALIKLNQIGTVTETLDALRVCHEAGWSQMISHRSGETTDTFIADLAVASGTGQIKAGAPARGERVAKYNRLLEISRAAPALPYGLADAD